MKRILFTLLVILGLNLGSKSQGYNNFQMSINYNIGVPLGDFSDYINHGSFRGMNLQVDYYLNDKFSIGGYFGWNGYYQKKDRESYEFTGGAINGVRYNYLYQLPMYLKAQYIISDNGNFMPFAAIGVGTHYIEQETYIGYVGFSDYYWKFATAPEVGALILMGQSGWQFKASAIYHLSFYNENNISSLQSLGINLGFNYDF